MSEKEEKKSKADAQQTKKKEERSGFVSAEHKVEAAETQKCWLCAGRDIIPHLGLRSCFRGSVKIHRLVFSRRPALKCHRKSPGEEPNTATKIDQVPELQRPGDCLLILLRVERSKVGLLRLESLCLMEQDDL